LILFNALTGEKARSTLNPPGCRRADKSTLGNGWEFSINRTDDKTALPSGNRLKDLIDCHTDKYLLELGETTADKCRTDCLNPRDICPCPDMDRMEIEFRNQSLIAILVVAKYGISE
jgi:hypothetical protein